MDKLNINLNFNPESLASRKKKLWKMHRYEVLVLPYLLLNVSMYVLITAVFSIYYVLSCEKRNRELQSGSTAKTTCYGIAICQDNEEFFSRVKGKMM